MVLCHNLLHWLMTPHVKTRLMSACDILEDASAYKDTSVNQDMKIMKELKKLVDREDTGLTKAELDFILNFETSIRNLYGLPKIHKSKLIQNTIKNRNTNPVILLNPEDLPFRPIVAGPNCPTSRLSNLIDIILKPLVSHVTSHISDSTDFLATLPTTVLNETLLATLMWSASILTFHIIWDLQQLSIRWINILIV